MKESMVGKYVSHCVCDFTGKVLEQSSKCQNICGERLGQTCHDGCREHLGLHKDSDALLLKNRQFHEGTFHISTFREDEREFIFLYPAVKKHNYFEFNILTRKEKEVVELMLKGFTNSEILARLSITRATLKTHINHIYQKLDEGFSSLRNPRTV